MIQVLSCLVTQHDLRLVAVAAMVCVLGSGIAVRLFTNTATGLAYTRAVWVSLAGFAFGSAVWSTHFLSMLAFDPGLPVGYEPFLTVLSLVVAVFAMTAGFGIAALPGRLSALIGGAVIGSGIGAMHYTGMAAMRTAGFLRWDQTLVLASLAMGGILAAFAMHRLTHSRGKYRLYEVALLLVVAIAGHHFTGMGAITIVPDPRIVVPEQMVPNSMMAIGITAVTLLVIGMAFITYFIDFRSRRAEEARFHHLAHFDTLTGLPNRAAILDRLEVEIRLAAACGEKFALLSLDLDRFKDVNDIFGHHAGDKVLAEAAARLRELADNTHFAGRLGGDEFVALSLARKQPEDALAFGEKLAESLCREINLDQHVVSVGASIGVAIFPDDGQTAEELMASADLAMYRAKEAVGNKIRFFERAMDDQVRQRRALGLELRDAIARNELELYYQVQKRISTGATIGYEALLRWHHPTRGSVSPAEFIPVAEETGFIIPIGIWVLRTACEAAAKWPSDCRIAVNLSPVQFQQGDLVEAVQGILLETGLSPARLELEITESTLIGDMNRTLHTLRRLKALGITIAMDDFGTGYSSLSTLRAFPFDKIKIDRSFVEKVDVNDQAAAIVRAILALGHSLSIPVLAEGIETSAHLAFLQREGCDEMQGYLLGRPAPLQDAARDLNIVFADTDEVQAVA